MRLREAVLGLTGAVGLTAAVTDYMYHDVLPKVMDVSALPLAGTIGNAAEGYGVVVLGYIFGEVLYHEYELEKARYLPEFSAVTIAAYTAVGETILPIMPYNTMHAEDIPAALIGTIGGYCTYQFFKRQVIPWFYDHSR